jgi:uncharacterized protein
MTAFSKEEIALISVLDGYDEIAIAVSGGVDSMVLAYMAHRFSRTKATMLHAISPAVPQAATARVKRYAENEGWRITWLDAGEFDDPNYRANPLNRCYYCKSNLYDRIRAATSEQIASGTNTDDLGDFRPGLKAASERAVIHPYVEAGLGKADIYRLAECNALADLAELPAQPCLASRVETGIAIDPEDLAFIEMMEGRAAALAPISADIRCRTTAAGVVIEVGAAFPLSRRETLATDAARLCAAHGRVFVGVRDYRRGSAFLR